MGTRSGLMQRVRQEHAPELCGWQGLGVRCSARVLTGHHRSLGPFACWDLGWETTVTKASWLKQDIRVGASLDWSGSLDTVG